MSNTQGVDDLFEDLLEDLLEELLEDLLQMIILVSLTFTAFSQQ